MIVEHGATFRTRGADAVARLAGPAPARASTACWADFALSAGETATFVLERVTRRPPPRQLPSSPRRPHAAFEDTVAFWRRWLATLELPRALARDGPPVGARAQAAHLSPRPERSSPRRPPQPARGHRRRAQLGLPLHLDPRRGVHALRPPAAGLHRGGGGVHGLARGPRASEAHGGPERPAADHVRDRRPPRPRPSRRSTTSTATSARSRCGSATPPPTSSSSTSTAS